MDAYAEWAPGYPPHPHNALMEVEQAAVLGLLPPVVGRKVLDAGCGTGRYMHLLAALGAHVVGVDASSAMASRAHAAFGSVIRADMSALPLSAHTFDVVVSGLAVIDVPILDQAVDEWARVLRHRGVVVYSTLHPAGEKFGWVRTFEVHGQTRTLPAHWHNEMDHRRACERAGLVIEAIEQPSLGRDGHAVAMVVRARRVSRG